MSATIVRGHQVASGANRDPRFPGGTLQMQLPAFRERGLDLSRYHLATLNLSIHPKRCRIGTPALTFLSVNWHPTAPAEDFSFFDCLVRRRPGEDYFPGLIYYPHPETKPEHFQDESVLEVILETFCENLSYGDVVELAVPAEQITFE